MGARRVCLRNQEEITEIYTSPFNGHIKTAEQRTVIQEYDEPAQSPPRCTKCNSTPINGQCTNFILFSVVLYNVVPVNFGL